MEVAIREYGKNEMGNGIIRNSTLKKYAPLRKGSLIHKSDILDELYQLKESNSDYITKSGEVYKYYYDDFYFKRSHYVNRHNGYVYVSITCKDGKNRNRRLHILMAQTFLPNPNPLKYKIVGHKDNNKSNYSLSNLYWTNNQENTQKAVDDGLNKNRKAEENDNSKYIAVKDKDTYEIVGVYGSLRECDRCIDNITFSTISKVYKKKKYKPRTRKYIYQECSLEEFEKHPNLQNIHLVENIRNDKTPKIFKMSNKKLQYSIILDNQVKASKICGLSQAEISHILIERDTSTYNGWTFELIGTIDRKLSSAYKNCLATVSGYTVENINDGRILEFTSGQELKNYFGLNGHDVKHYVDTNQILMSEWRIIKTNNNKKLEELCITF